VSTPGLCLDKGIVCVPFILDWRGTVRYSWTKYIELRCSRRVDLWALNVNVYFLATRQPQKSVCKLNGETV